VTRGLFSKTDVGARDDNSLSSKITAGLYRCDEKLGIEETDDACHGDCLVVFVSDVGADEREAC
jgi:hypothetical protein